MRQLIWILPFIAFLTGYYVLKNICVITELEAPPLIGLPIHQAIVTLSGLSLNARIIAQQEKSDIPNGTILSQNPLPGQKIKPHQSIFLVVSQTPEKPTMPSLVGKHEKEIEETLHSLNIPYKKYAVASNAIPDTCFAQHPASGEEVTHNATLYFSTGEHKHVIMPNFKNLPVLNVLDFLQKNQITFEIIHPYQQPFGHQCQECVVTDQRPLEGSLIDLSAQNKMVVQLKVSSHL